MARATAIYARISSDPDDSRLGVERQLADCRALAARIGWAVVREYVDNDISASGAKRRPQYRQMLEDIKTGHVDGVIVWADDRLHRRPKELEEFFEIVDAAGIKDLATVSGHTDLSTDEGKLQARILGAVAANESAKLTRRIRRKHEELAEKGKLSGGGHRPYGFEADRLTIRLDEAHSDQGAGEPSPCRRQSAFDVPGISTNVDCPRSREGSGDRTSFDACSCLLASAASGSILARLSALPSGRGSSRQPIPQDSVPCSAIPAVARTGAHVVICSPGCSAAHCAEPPSLLAPRWTAAVPMCVPRVLASLAAGGGISMLADDLESLIVEAVLYRLDTPALAHRLAKRATETTDASAIADALAADQARLDELAVLFADGEIRKAEWLKARRRIDERVTANKKKLSRMTYTSALDGFVGNSEGLRKMWSHLPLARQQAVVAAVIDHVVASPALKGSNRFDPNRFTPVWRR